MKVAILGFAREGKSTLKFLKKHPVYSDAEFWILDASPKCFVPRGLKSVLGKGYLSKLKQFDVVFRSPGVPYNNPELKRARQVGVKFSSLTNLFFEYCPAKIIGVTGTKGKGTTSTLIYKILKSAGKKVFLAGNIGKPALEILPKLDKNSWVVLELSSFQLQDLDKSPRVAVVLDVFPDHQDAHLSLKEYYEAKSQIARYQKRADKIFFFKNNSRSRWIAKKSRGRKIAVDERALKEFAGEDLCLKGAHNFKNAAMAYAVAKALGVPKKIVVRIIKEFPGIEHRLELVGRTHGVSFYNDSASTNPHTTAAAVKAFSVEPNVLIAGGQDKKLDYAPLLKALKHSTTELVVLFGENKHKIKKSINKSGVNIKMATNLNTAVKTAYHFAKSIRATVIFSPGAASFDMFKNYADRGEKFKKLVRSL